MGRVLFAPRPAGLRTASFLASVALVLWAPAGWTATLLQRPYLQNQREDRATILWTTRENLPAVVQYAPDKSYSSSVIARVREFPSSLTGLPYTFYLYQADLTGLTPGIEYFYQVVVGGQNLTANTNYRFRTARPGPFTFLVLGDSGTGTAAQQAVALQMASEQPDLVLHVGDVAQYDGTFVEYSAYYFEYYWTLMRQVPFFSVPGNHDYITGYAQPYLSFQAQPSDGVPLQDAGRYYSFDRGDVHFVALDSNLLADAAAAPRMLAWLKSDLALAGAPWKIAYFHHLPYPISHHADDPVCMSARAQFVPLFDQYGVQLVFSGHEHTYQRTKPMRQSVPVASGPGTVYVVSGGGGGPLHGVEHKDFLVRAESLNHYLRVEADASRITIRAIGADGKELDRYTLTRPSLRPDAPVVSAASGAPETAPGGLISVYGEGLAGGTDASSGPAYPLALAGTTVTVDGRPSPLLFVSDTQINAQVPYGATGTVAMQVSTPAGAAKARVQVADTAPAIFPSGVWHSSGAPVTPASPVRPGETIVIYLTGLGQVGPGIATGQVAPASPLATVAATVTVQVGTRLLKPSFAGLTPGCIGVYQVSVITPTDLPAETHSLRVSAGGNFSNPFSLPVRAQ